MRYRSLPILLLIVMTVLISACEVHRTLEPSSTAESTSVPPLIVNTDTSLPPSTHTLAATSTHKPSPTSTLTPTPSITPSITPTQFFGFEDALVYKALAYEDETLFYFIVPGVAASYYGTVDGFQMACEPDLGQENLLECRSEENLFGTDVKAFEFYADEAQTVLVYAGKFSTTLNQRPPTPAPDGTIWPRADFTAADINWGQTPSGCTARGINLSCEIEYRLYDDGSCLVGMSCFDSCGYYYSVNTIKDKTGDWIPWGPCW
jgi:hypothetical protein